jgi:hypothetical protein
MNHESLKELETTLRLIQRQPNGFTFRDRIYTLDNAQVQQYGKPFAETQALTNLLYSEAYARKRSAGSSSLHMPETTPEFLQQQQAFAEQLSAHNFTTPRIDEGWMVLHVHASGQLNVSKGGTNIVLQPNEYRLAAGVMQPVINSLVTRITAKENRALQPAFYYVYSEAGFDYLPTIVRIYWNLEATGAHKLVQHITQKLNYYRLPFLFKCLNHPEMYKRRDAAVLYVQKRYLAILEEILPLIIAEVSTHLQKDVPLFSYALAPGVGFAESPVNGDSFGLVRMRMVSTGLMRAFDKQHKETEQQLSEIIAAFTEQGINPVAPYLNEGSMMTLKPMNI